jgi:dephospho-CoA kinase
MRIGLTGGIASGKSTVSNLFSEQGIDIIDADVVARQVVEPGQAGLAEIIKQFGERFLDADGRLDRQQMRQQIFSIPASRTALEAIIHPRVREAMLQQAGESNSVYCILCIPLLAENKLQSMVDRVLVIDVETVVQKKRLMARDSSSPEQVEAILAAQASREERLAVADDVIDNNLEPARLQPQVAALHLKYLQLPGGEPN